jgi:pyruvate kinase
MEWIHLKDQIIGLINDMKSFEKRHGSYIAAIPTERQPSVRNFLHYLSLRGHDVRKLQHELADLGLSSLGRSEGYVMGNIKAILKRIEDTMGDSIQREEPSESEAMSWHHSEQILHKNTQMILGPRPSHRHVYIMVTAPESSTMGEDWIDRSLSMGMNILRINAAHESLAGIKNLIQKARQKALEHRVSLKILVDIPGPKMRTRAPQEGAQVLRLKPTRNIFGEVLVPASAHLHTDDRSYCLDPNQNKILLEHTPQDLGPKDLITFQDARGRKRSLRVAEKTNDHPEVFRVTSEKTIYLRPQTQVTLPGAKGRKIPPSAFPVVLTHHHRVPWSQTITLGQRFCILSDPGENLIKSQMKNPKGLSTELSTEDSILPWIYVPPVIMKSLRKSDKIMFDDGKIVTTVVEIAENCATLQVEQASKGVARLRGEMGINVPDKELDIPAVSPSDLVLIEGIKEDADLLGLSFVRSAADIESYRQALGATKIPFVIKVETQSGFRHLPEIMLSALSDRLIAVMIARGDLAVECGFERLAEVQEEILWFCEAAHVPVVWATQVLETLAKTGIPTRAEITDAAMSVRAECVMLNKGPFIHEAIKSLDSILMRMETHQYKKRQLYRPLKIKLPG